MDHSSRFIGLAIFLAIAIFRLIRYLRIGAANRRAPAVPGTASAGMQTQRSVPSAPAMTAASPIAPAPGGLGLLGGLAAVLVLLAGNAAVWTALFLVPQLEPVPVMLRLAAGVLANFYLIYLARSVAARVRGQSGQDPPAGGNPIS